MEQMIGRLAKKAAKVAIVAVLLACGLGVGGALGGGLAYVPVVAQEGEDDDGCENNHCGRVNVRWWFDRDACLPNGDRATSCIATDEHGNCEDDGCTN